MVLLITLLTLVGTSPVTWLQETTVQAPDTFKGEPVMIEFRFRNDTDAPLLVENVRVGCGCTATDWQDAAVAPGAESSINVTYDAMNVGFYRKYVKVYFRGHRGGHKLWVEGYVEGEGR